MAAPRSISCSVGWLVARPIATWSIRLNGRLQLSALAAAEEFRLHKEPFWPTYEKTALIRLLTRSMPRREEWGHVAGEGIVPWHKWKLMEKNFMAWVGGGGAVTARSASHSSSSSAPVPPCGISGTRVSFFFVIFFFSLPSYSMSRCE